MSLASTSVVTVAPLTALTVALSLRAFVTTLVPFRSAGPA